MGTLQYTVLMNTHCHEFWKVSADGEVLLYRVCTCMDIMMLSIGHLQALCKPSN